MSLRRSRQPRKGREGQFAWLRCPALNERKVPTMKSQFLHWIRTLAGDLFLRWSLRLLPLNDSDRIGVLRGLAEQRTYDRYFAYCRFTSTIPMEFDRWREISLTLETKARSARDGRFKVRESELPTTRQQTLSRLSRLLASTPIARPGRDSGAALRVEEPGRGVELCPPRLRSHRARSRRDGNGGAV